MFINMFNMNNSFLVNFEICFCVKKNVFKKVLKLPFLFFEKKTSLTIFHYIFLIRSIIL